MKRPICVAATIADFIVCHIVQHFVLDMHNPVFILGHWTSETVCLSSTYVNATIWVEIERIAPWAHLHQVPCLHQGPLVKPLDVYLGYGAIGLIIDAEVDKNELERQVSTLTGRTHWCEKTKPQSLHAWQTGRLAASKPAGSINTNTILADSLAHLCFHYMPCEPWL